MTLADREHHILSVALSRLNDCEQIQIVLKANFAPKQRKHNDTLNVYRKNSIICAMVYPLAILFFNGQIPYDNPNVIDDLEKYLRAYLQKMKFGGDYYAQASKEKE